MEYLDSELKIKQDELNNLEQEEKRRKILLYEKEKEIEAKMKTIHDLNSKEMCFKNKKPSEKVYDITSIRKIQRIYRKLNLFNKIEANRKNLIFSKLEDFLFPSVLKNHVEQNFIPTAKRKTKLIFYLQKPTKMVLLKILIKTPKILIFEHTLNFCNIIIDKKYEEDFCGFLQSVCLEILNHFVMVELKFVGISMIKKVI